MNILLVAILFSIGLLEPVPSPSTEAAMFGTVVVEPDATIVYKWPPVSTAFLLTTPLREIDIWMRRQETQAAVAVRDRRHQIGANCPLPTAPCFCMNGIVGPHPIDGMLTAAQWSLLINRIRWDAERTNDLTHIRSLLNRLSPTLDSDRPATVPDLTSLLLVVVDAASRGDTTCLVEIQNLNRLAKNHHGVFDREAIRTRLGEAMDRASDREQVGALVWLAHNFGLTRTIETPATFE